jgi:hypothetical protein
MSVRRLPTLRRLQLGLIAAFVLGVAFAAQPPAPVRAASGLVLYGVTGDGAFTPETLYTIDPATAQTTLFQTLGNGDDGEDIAYDPSNGLMLHASGYQGTLNVNRILEWVSPSNGDITPITASGHDYSEISASTYAGDHAFLAGDINGRLLSISESGVITLLGQTNIDYWLTGLAFVGPTLYAVEWADQGETSSLLTIAPSNGQPLTTQALTLEGAESFRLTALATEPCTGELYGVLTTGDYDGLQARLLVTIDPDTAEVTPIGDLGDAFAGITFVGHCPSLEVKKLLLPFWDAGRFLLGIDGYTETGPVGNNGTTGAVDLEPGQYTVYETGAGNTSLGNYRTTVLCYGRGGGFVSYGFSTSLTLQVQPAQQVTCTFINQRIWSWFWWR